MTSAELKERGYYFSVAAWGVDIFMRKPDKDEVMEDDDMYHIHGLMFHTAQPFDKAVELATEWCDVHYVKTKLEG